MTLQRSDIVLFNKRIAKILELDDRLSTIRFEDGTTSRVETRLLEFYRGIYNPGDAEIPDNYYRLSWIK